MTSTITKDDAIKAIEGEGLLDDTGTESDLGYTAGLDAAIEAIRALPDAGWRDIESAPKDAMILAHADGMVRLVMWEAGRWVQVGKTIEHGWFEPLHWMPLPPPPEKA